MAVPSALQPLGQAPAPSSNAAFCSPLRRANCAEAAVVVNSNKPTTTMVVCVQTVHGKSMDPSAQHVTTTERRFGRRPHAHAPPTLVCLPWKNLRETCRRTTVVPRRARRRSNRRVPKAGHAALHPQTHIARAVCDMGHTSQVSLCASLFQALNVHPALPRVNDARG